MNRVVVLRDPHWPVVAGVCCWRAAVRAAFEAAGARVEEVDVAGVPVPRPPAPPRSPRLPWLPGPVRRPAARAYRLTRRLTTRPAPPPRDDALAPTVADATLLVAESPAVASVALRSGAAADRLWVLALPEERGQAPDEELDELAAAVAGFLTDGETARDAVERAVTSGRPRVVLFPPLAVDRSCAAHGPLPVKDQPWPHVRQLALWRSMMDGATVTYSYAAARLREPDWTASRWSEWSGDLRPDAPLDGGPPQWTASRQDRAAEALLAAAPPRGVPGRTVLVSGYQLKFFSQLAAHLAAGADLALTLDEWPWLSVPGQHTAQRLARARTVLAEWARPSAVWLSRHKRPGQFLVVRLHRYEIDKPYPRQIDIDAVDAVVHVSRPMGRRITDELGWPAAKLVYIPNFVDMDWLDRPKLPEARFSIGVVGAEYANKRLDLALDLVARVRRVDPRYGLVVRTVPPWQSAYAWDRPEEREYVGWWLERVERDPLLRGAVRFDPPGPDMARWYRGVGHVLSTSDVESFHLGLADGMASGAVPVIRPWPGASEIYGSEWVYGSASEAADAILAAGDAALWARRSAAARGRIREICDPAAVVAAWTDLLSGDVEAARRHFA
jgi:glycosyltransferase involved in cell wall biosynthesis